MTAKKKTTRKSNGQYHLEQSIEGAVTNKEVQAAAQTEEEEEVGPATADEILGIDSSSEGKRRRKRITREEEVEVPSWVKPEWVKFYRKLVATRNQILEQLEALAEDSATQLEVHSVHEADIGTDTYDRDFALSMLSSHQELLYEIEEAIKRIEKGTYGICELTGKPIPKARLEAVPWARFTVEAQEQLEREGVIKKRGLANLGMLKIGSGEEESEEEEERENLEGLAE